MDVPEDFVFGEPVADGPQWTGVEAMEDLAAGASRFVQTTGFEQTQVLDDGGAGHVESLFDLIQRKFLASQEVEHAPAGGVGDGAKEPAVGIGCCRISRPKLGHGAGILSN